MRMFSRRVAYIFAGEDEQYQKSVQNRLSSLSVYPKCLVSFLHCCFVERSEGFKRAGDLKWKRSIAWSFLFTCPFSPVRTWVTATEVQVCFLVWNSSGSDIFQIRAVWMNPKWSSNSVDPFCLTVKSFITGTQWGNQGPSCRQITVKKVSKGCGRLNGETWLSAGVGNTWVNFLWIFLGRKAPVTYEVGWAPGRCRLHWQ